MGNIAQYGTITLTKFANADFDLSVLPADQVVIRKVNLDSDIDNIVFQTANITASKNTAAGTELRYTTPGGESKSLINFYEDPSRKVYDFLYSLASPTSVLNAEGKIEHYAEPGIDFTDFRNICNYKFVPVDVDENPDESKSVVIPRTVIIMEEAAKMGQPNTMPVTFMGQGGERLALMIGTADLSSNVDLSSGATDKLVKITMNGLSFDVNFLQDVATTLVSIISAIDTAFSASVASDQGGFLQLKSTLFAAPIIVEDPDVGASGLSLIFGFSERTVVKGTEPKIIK